MEQPPTDLTSLPEFLTVEEWRAIMRLGRSNAYEAIRRGDIEHTTIGRAIRIPKRVILRAAGRTA